LGFTGYELSALAGIPKEQKILKGRLPRVMYHQVYNVYEDQIARENLAGGFVSKGRGVFVEERRYLEQLPCALAVRVEG